MLDDYDYARYIIACEIRRFLLTASASMPRILKAEVDDNTVTTTDERGDRRTYQRAEIESWMTAKPIERGRWPPGAVGD